MSCILSANERDYNFQIPIGYWQLPYMLDLPYEEWLQIFRDAGAKQQIRPALAELIVKSLERMPDLEPGQDCIPSLSLGKDSVAHTMLGIMRYGRDRIKPLYCDTKDEWQDTYEYHPVFEDWIEIPITTLDTTGLHTQIRFLKNSYPQVKKRWCTKELKLLPQRDWMDDMGYDQVRYDKRSARKRKNLGYEPVDVRFPAPLLLAGERWAESKEREKLEFDQRTKELMRWTHRPVLDWSIEDIWDFIFFMQAPINMTYDKGVKRVACAGCIFASKKEFRLLGEIYPGHLERWVMTEHAVGVNFIGGFSLKELYVDMYSERHLQELLKREEERALRPRGEIHTTYKVA